MMFYSVVRLMFVEHFVLHVELRHEQKLFQLGLLFGFGDRPGSKLGSRDFDRYAYQRSHAESFDVKSRLWVCISSNF